MTASLLKTKTLVLAGKTAGQKFILLIDQHQSDTVALEALKHDLSELKEKMAASVTDKVNMDAQLCSTLFRAELALDESSKKTDEAYLKIDALTQNSAEEMQHASDNSRSHLQRIDLLESELKKSLVQHQDDNVALEALKHDLSESTEVSERKLASLNSSNTILQSSIQETVEELATTLEKLAESHAENFRYKETWVDNEAHLTRELDTCHARVLALEGEKSSLSQSLKKNHDEATKQLSLVSQQHEISHTALIASQSRVIEVSASLESKASQLIDMEKHHDHLMQGLKRRNEILMQTCVNEQRAIQTGSCHLSRETKLSEALEKCETYASHVCELENQLVEARKNSLRAELALDESSKKTGDASDREMTQLHQELTSWQRQANAFMTSKFPTTQDSESRHPTHLFSSPSEFFDTVHESVVLERQRVVSERQSLSDRLCLIEKIVTSLQEKQAADNTTIEQTRRRHRTDWHQRFTVMKHKCDLKDEHLHSLVSLHADMKMENVRLRKKIQKWRHQSAGRQ